MKVLMITGDKRFGPGHPRYELQRRAVEELAVLYWGRGAWWPHVPAGNFDVVSAQDPFWRGHLAWHLARRKGAKLNIQVHTDLSAQPWWRRMFAQLQLRNADTVRVVSEKIKQQVVHISPHAKVTVLPVFVEIEKFRSVVHEPHAPKTMLWIGRFEKEKDPELAISVLQEMLREGFDGKLVMLGRGSLEGELRKQATGLAPLRGISVPLPVEFAGWHDPREYLSRAEVVLCTSKHESYGASIVEALAAGVPVVSPDVGVAREAGAYIAERGNLAAKVAEVLKSNPKGELKLPVLNTEEWAKKWKESLLVYV